MLWQFRIQPGRSPMHATKRNSIVVEMTREEAAVLHKVTQFVGGPPKGYRGVIDSLSKELRSVGIGFRGDVTGSISFQESRDDRERQS